jgi:hypothetical protein
MKADHQLDMNLDLALQESSLAETYGVSPQVAPQAASGKLSPKECTTEQLLEIVIGVARRFRTAKVIVAENKEYVLRLKTEVFKVRFGSVGVRVLVAYKDEQGLLVSGEMNWNEFCGAQFGVSADWISRICGWKAEGRRQASKTQRERPTNRHGYEAEKAEMQSQLKAAAEKEAALAGRIADLEKENERLQGIARQLQEQAQESGDKTAAKLPSHVERLKEFLKLATEAFDIINGRYGERLMASLEGKRLVEIAKKAAAMKGKVKVL